jgi:hypothetical protein
MNEKETTESFRQIIELIKREIRPEMLAEIRAEVAATRAEDQPKRVMLSLASISERYGVGRIVVKKMIQSGQLPATERECRGGRIGTFVHVADADRCFSQVKTKTK